MTESAGKRSIPYLIGVIVLVAAAALSAYWLLNPAKAQRRRPPQQAPLVELQQVEVRSERIQVEAMGTVVPVRHMDLAARVGGQVGALAEAFRPGGRFAQGTWMLKLDSTDLELAVLEARAAVQKRDAELQQRRSDVSQRALDVELATIQIERAQGAVDQADSQVVSAQSRLRIEMGLQSVAQTDYQTVPREVNPEERELMLRQPQLRAAQAACEAAVAARSVAVAERKAAEAARRTAEERKRAAESAADAAAAELAAAEAAFKKAELDLKRSTIEAPFNGMVLAKDVDLGSQIAVGERLASLIGTDAFWIQISVPVDQLKWLDIPGFNSDRGSAVTVFHEAGWGDGASRPGRVQQIMTDLEPEGRMARLLVEVSDPLDLAKPASERHALILNSYVRVAVQGRAIEDVVRIPRSALRDGRRVWVADDQDKLEIREVRVIWGGAEDVLVADGLRDGERLIISDLGAPVQSMLLRTGRRVADETEQAAERQP